VAEKRNLPEFRNEREEAEFWDTHSLADYWDELEPVQVEVDPELKKKMLEGRKTKRITLRLREYQLEAVKKIAEKKDIPYQTLIRSWVAEAIRRETAGEI